MFLRSNLDFLNLRYRNLRGALVETNIALDYNPWKNFGIGAGSENFRVKLDAEGVDYPGLDSKGDIKMQFIGVQLYSRCFI